MSRDCKNPILKQKKQEILEILEILAVFIAFPLFQWSPWGRVEGVVKKKFFLLQLIHLSKIICNFAVKKVMMSENKRNLTEKDEYYI